MLPQPSPLQRLARLLGGLALSFTATACSDAPQAPAEPASSAPALRQTSQAAVSEISLIFSEGYFATQGASTNKADNIVTFGTLGVEHAGFFQTDPNGDGRYGNACTVAADCVSGYECRSQTCSLIGGTQGNDLAGTLRLYLTDGSLISLTGALNFRETTGSTVEVFGFIFDPGQNGSISYGTGSTYTITGGTGNGTTTSVGLKAYASTVSFTDAENRTGNAATNGLLLALNTELASASKPSAIVAGAADTVEEIGRAHV